MSQILLSTLVGQMSMRSRCELVIRGDTRETLAFTKSMLDAMVTMATKTSGQTRASMADLMRDAADVIERPLLTK